MTTNKDTTITRTCIDCGRDISHLHHHTKRCEECSKLRKQQQDRLRHLKQRSKALKWLFFIENPETKELTHRSAKGSKLRYWLDKICKELTIQELDFLLLLWDGRVKDLQVPPTAKREYRTCAGIVRDWRDYLVVNQVFTDVSFDAETGIIYNTDGSYLTVDFDEDQETYVVRNSEGTVICQY